MGKYAPLRDHLASLKRSHWSASFDEIENILGFKLPPSARKYREWWANSNHGHTQSRGWMDAGWHVNEVDQSGEKVELTRYRTKDATNNACQIDDLWKRAAAITGIDNHKALQEEVLKSYLRQKAGNSLIALGGAMADAKEPPRRRSE